ncbi:DUF262 domain-containing protein [Chryseobacterium lathyri]|uniref:DUF262 domain-containing protein n=1 Tax=Chryseobacterium lathyri TaxID=395933 RepID=UPI0027889B4E|nr:DUF262 domain-containing protein [Chryseobacterium lathyri]MDQ0066950.1 uncharacterized protein with ParB-like and HNH nuclease domain [Chryseobacterium lathyri]
MAELHVSKKSISKLFSDMQDKKFIIPDYQRPYKWTLEKCETLWNDIESFANTDAKKGADYFLGTIVSFKNGEDSEIIDGQQRITSFFLLLRAFYRKLEVMTEDDDVRGLKTQIEPCIWDINPISTKVSDKTKIHIISEVATEEDNETFHKILETGLSSDNATDNYSVNYRFFKKQCDDYAEINPMQWKQLCITILQKCIILPIECDTSEVALTIFSTLNDRGLPLSDSDIFKAQIYRNLPTVQTRKEFTNRWKELTQICKEAKVSIDDIFRYYTHILRARNNDKSKEVGLRKFYAEEQYKRLKEPLIMEEIMSLAEFWRYINSDIESESNNYEISKTARKYLQCLNCYPNEYWKYPISVFFLKHRNSAKFDVDFIKVLKKHIAFLFAKFIDAPSVNAIKDDIYGTCIAIQNEDNFNFRFTVNEEQLGGKIDGHSSSRLSRALLLLHAYLHTNQLELIPDTFDIEHIFPKKWQDTNYNGWNIDDAMLNLDRFGNKIVFEKKLNIQAGNGYFGVKKQKYNISNIAVVKDLSNYHKSDWVKEDINSREIQFKSDLLNFFKLELN